MSDSAAQPGNEASGPTNHRRLAGTWMPLDEAASLIGANYETLRLFVRGSGGRAVLPSIVRKGVVCVRPGDAYAHLLAHAPRCRGLVAPAGFNEGTAADVPADPPRDPDAAQEADLVEMLQRLIRDLERQAAGRITSDQLRAIAQAVQSAEKLLDAREKAKLKLDPDAVVKMLRSLGDVWCAEAQDRLAPNAAAALIKYCRETFGLDLAAHNSDVLQLFTSIIQEEARASIPSVQKKVDDLCAGVRELELEGPQK